MEPSEYAPLPPEAHSYMDGLLGGDAERAFEKLLERDSSLKQRVNEMQAARKLLQSVALVEPPASFDKGIYERIKYVDLASGARERIARSGSIWQGVSWLATGAIAASVALVLIGNPFGSKPATDTVPDKPFSGEVANVSLTESDVMPLFADQYDRFRELQRHVMHSGGNDAARRDLVRGELELSDIGPRCKRLQGMVESLPVAERREYARFFDSLSDCCESIDAELVKSQTEQRAPSRQTLGAALAGVYIPSRLSSEAGMLVTRFGPSGRGATTSRVSVGKDAELALYLEGREAFYARNYASAARAFENYIAKFPKGRFNDSARASSASALMRAGYTDSALDRYIADVKGQADRLALVDETDQALFRQADLERARRAPAPKDEDR